MRNFDAEANNLPVLDFDERMHEFMWRTFEPHFQGARALELGCFRGHMTSMILNRFNDVTVVDASQECIDAAKKAATSETKCIEFIHGQFETVELDRQFDAIFCTHVLEHCEHPGEVLERCRDWLKPDTGRLFLAVPNALAASRLIAVGMGLLKYPDEVTETERAHGHFHTFSLPALRWKIEEAGLRRIADGGILFKALSGAQMDKALAAGIITPEYLEGCYQLGRTEDPGGCASIYAVCGRDA